MIVDAHHHLWAADAGYTWLDAPDLAPINRTFTPAMLTAELAAAGVARSVLVEGGRCDTDEAAVLLGHAADTPEIAGVVAWADPASPELASTLAGFRALPGGDRLVGIRAQVQGEDLDYLDRTDVRAGLATIGAAGLAFDLVVRVDQLASAARAADALPSVRFVLDHLGKPRIMAGAEGLAEWRAAIAPLASCPNVAAKLSGLVTEADWQRWTVDDLRPYASSALEFFGAERLMLGSDWPVCLLAGDYGAVRSAMLTALGGLTATERAAILGDTASRVYRLSA
ncbi:amidohydrolase family protein [Asanoa iriomotensis]|uniref:Amidohydrolase n=1 Tax=Asanoa iriomotensis TaxID=234613 RepID=A0ABQ4C6Q1_9ACTN|nr:amidohydrolase family protein [Asanoa iriomotensis]GIF58456.1 amidohydrolase [Asanoa iriomotensis]